MRKGITLIFLFLHILGGYSQSDSTPPDRRVKEITPLTKVDPKIVFENLIINLPYIKLEGIDFVNFRGGHTNETYYYDELSTCCGRFQKARFPKIRSFDGYGVSLIHTEVNAEEFELSRTDDSDKEHSKIKTWRGPNGAYYFLNHSGRQLSEGEIEALLTNIDIYSREALRYNKSMIQAH